MAGEKLAVCKTDAVPGRICRRECRKLQTESQADSKSVHAAQRNVILIGRQFGSGGHDIGKALAEKLGYAFYDQEIIEMTAGTTGYTPEFVQKNEEMMTSSFLYDLVNQMYMYAQPDRGSTEG